MQYRRVVVGVDFSASSLTAARWVAPHTPVAEDALEDHAALVAAS